LLLLAFSWLPWTFAGADGFCEGRSIDGIPSCSALAAFSSEMEPDRIKKTHQFENREPRFDSIEREKALD
jgi:hypothetical protein